MTKAKSKLFGKIVLILTAAAIMPVITFGILIFTGAAHFSSMTLAMTAATVAVFVFVLSVLSIKPLIESLEELALEKEGFEQKMAEHSGMFVKTADERVKKERLAAIGEMASIISHEIRNPLAVISNSAKLIRAITGEDNPKLQRQFSIIDNEVRQANRIVEEVLGYARNRKQILSRVRINDYMKEVALSQSLPSNIRLEQHYCAENPVISVDAEEMKLAFRNIIANAVDVMPSGGVLCVGTRCGKKAVEISIKDEGIGMGEETRLKLFTPFFTTKARGTGLGLAVVKKAVQNNRGKVFVESEKGEGTLFKIYLKREK